MSRIILVALLVSISAFSLAQDFVETAPYTSPSGPARNTCGEGNDCNQRNSPDHEYQVTIPWAGNWIFSLCGSSFNTDLYVGTTLCSNDIGDDDDGCAGTNRSVLTANIAAGIYFVTVEGRNNGGNCGDYILDISGPPAPTPGANCLNPIVLSAASLPYAALGENTGNYGDDYSTSPCDDDYMDGDEVVYTFTAGSTTEFIEISAAFTATWGGIHVLDDCPDVATTCIASDFLTGTGTASIQCLTVPANSTYYIVISTYPSPQTTGYDLNISTCIPPGDECATALPIACGDAITGTTVGFNPPSASACITGNGSEGSVWYTIQGTGADITASLCGGTTNFNTRLRVFSGDCVGLVCVDGNDDFCGTQSEVTFGSTIGTTYYILVSGSAGNEGAYTLTITCEASPGDICTSAIPIACNQTISGTTIGANPETVGTCGTGDGTGGAIWFEFTGTGDLVTASLCGSSFDTRIRIFEGTCAGLICVDGDDDGCSGLQSQVAFISVLNTTYYILVSGYTSNEGAFELSMSCVTAPTNTSCASAQSIACGATVSSNIFGSPTSTETVCGGIGTSTSGALWYQFTGNGDIITASLCGGGTTYDSELLIYSGNCGSLTCEFGNDAFCGSQSQISFSSVNGTNYYIMVTGDSGNEGAFTLQLDCLTPTGSDVCSGATTVTCGGSYSGSTVGMASESIIPDCGTSDGTGGAVWYQFAGNDEYITASLCGSSFDTRIRIYTPSDTNNPCNTLTCVDGNDDYAGCSQTNNSEIVFESIAGTIYYILVHGTDAQEGLFTLSISCSTNPYLPSDCQGSEPLCAEGSLADINPTGTGNIPDLVDGNDGCLSGENATQWFYFKTLSTLPGNGSCQLEFTIETALGTDYDFAVWGPFLSGPESCVELVNGADPIRCSYSGDSGNTGLMINPPTPGVGEGTGSTEPAGGDGWVDAILADGNEYYILVIDNWSQNGEKFAVSFPLSTSNCLDCTILPIELLDFSGHSIEGKNVLEWTTAVEINNDYFTIERSKDSFDFHTIGTLSGAGNSSQPLNYSLVDESPLPGTNYYRLTQTDFDGTSETFQIIAIESDVNVGNFKLFPNPGSEIITVISSLNNERETVVTINDARGFVVEQFALTPQYMKFDVSQLPAGMYIITMTNEHSSETLTFIKQ